MHLEMQVNASITGHDVLSQSCSYDANCDEISPQEYDDEQEHLVCN